MAHLKCARGRRVMVVRNVRPHFSQDLDCPVAVHREDGSRCREPLSICGVDIDFMSVYGTIQGYRVDGQPNSTLKR